MDPIETVDPVLCCDEFEQIVDLLFCHGLHKDFPNLLTKIVDKFPDFEQKFSSPHRQVLILLAYCHKFQQNGPLPDIRHYMFLHTLHDGVVGLLKTEQRLVELMSRTDIYKLVGGVRCLLARSILMSPKFTTRDIETTIASFFPTLPVKPSNNKHWESWAEILNIDLEEKCEVLKEDTREVLQMVNKVNAISAKYMKDKLDNLPVERRKTCHDESIVSVWNPVASKFDEFVRHLRSLLPENFLDKIDESSHPKIKMISFRIQPHASEVELMDFLDYLCDIYMESKFWTSNFVLEKISTV